MDKIINNLKEIIKITGIQVDDKTIFENAVKIFLSNKISEAKKENIKETKSSQDNNKPTEKQLRFLQDQRFKIPEGLTKNQATKIIQDYFNRLNKEKQVITPKGIMMIISRITKMIKPYKTKEDCLKNMKEGYKIIQSDMKSKNGNHIWEVGKWYKFKGEIELCKSGFHACEKPHEVLEFIYGDKFFQIESKGKIIKSEDGAKKFVASEMRLVKELPLKEISVKFACYCARSCLENFEKEYPNDKRPEEAIKAAEAYMDNKISLEELNKKISAAWSAARSAESAARSAARSAAWSAEPAARSAAWSAESAAWSAARSAAESAARSAAESAAWSAAWSAESAARSAESAARSAARSAAWSAARSAAESAANKEFDKIVDSYL